MTWAPETEGIYFDLPEKVYRDAPGVSQSELKRFGRAATPKHFKAESPKAPTPDMEFGTVVHCATLNPHKLGEAFHLQPDEYETEVKGAAVKKKWHGGASECKRWLASHSDRPVLITEQFERIPKIVSRLKALEEFGEALEAGQKEVSYFKRDETTGLMLKCRCDLVVTDSEGYSWVWDLKKVQAGFANAYDFGKQCDDLAYDVQCASYRFITGATRFIFVAFDDDEPFDAIQFEPDGDFVNTGWRRYRMWLAAYAECFKNDKWPGYPAGLSTLSLPRYAVKRFEQ